jgi:signal transduction histidine kinase
LAEVRESLGVLAAEKQQTMEFITDNGLTVNADRLLLRQALMNIVHNAVRYSPQESCIVVRSTQVRSGAVIEIVDQGPGIAPEHRGKIFDRFYRVDKARSRAEGGHGLGLAIAKWSIDRQGGSIEVESDTEKGSLFRIILPL